MAKRNFLLAAVLCSALLAGCDTGPRSAIGFRLPDGDENRGREAFLSLQCHSCHDVAGETLPAAVDRKEIIVQLGGPVGVVKTYGQLVSAIIFPSHKITGNLKKDQVTRDGESLMRDFNDTMTVQQLIDLVAFLQPRYNVVLPERPYF